MQTKLLEELGLTKSEIKVYYSLLGLGSTSTGKLVESAEVSSSKIYEILDKLIDKGLVSFVIKSGVKYFEAAPPKRIMDYVEEKEKKLAEQKHLLNSFLPELELKRTLSKYKSEAKIYKGMKGIQTAFYESLDLLKKGEECLVMGIPKRDKNLDAFFTMYAKERAKKGIHAREIFNVEAIAQAQTESRVKHLKVKYIDEVTPAAINIFKDRIIIFPKVTDEPILIVIDNPEIAESFRVQFEMMWNQDTSVKKGFDELRKQLLLFIDELDAGETYDVLGAGYGGKGEHKMYVDFFQKIHEYRCSKGVKGRLLFQQGIDKKMLAERAAKNSEVKFLLYNDESPVELLASNKKVLMIIQRGDNPTTFVMNNPEVAETFKLHFEALWKQSERRD